MSNNFTTIVFGCALLSNDTEVAYNWFLEVAYNWFLATIIEAMDGRRPILVITDGDKSMRKGIKKNFLDARHRLCSWHLERKARTNVHHKRHNT